ncbi:hypothetical protein [Parapedobacter sp. 10938]|uniref:hypothetical protein n=1 Tax=Parapedobacter flavus TaxID=3110225 RepID=UPI002DBF26A3|nr:hypothetical protein [Parapedobacter sp. 10938]MEC3881808.1 hypothetical protein [Parapedobacter sp. 10938]
MAHLEELRKTALSFYNELNRLVESHYPEASLIHEEDELRAILRSHAEHTAEEYHRLIDSGEDKQTAHEFAMKELLSELGNAYSDEVADVLEQYPEIYKQLKELDDDKYMGFMAEIAKRVYFDVNDSEARKSRLYIPPYAAGYTKEEEDRIKQLTIKAYNSLSLEASTNATHKSTGPLQ